VKHECTPADARTLRLDQSENHLHGDRCIHRAASRAQDLQAGLRGKRVRSGDHLPLHNDGTRAGASRRNGLRRGRQIGSVGCAAC
jgi:hypothetical protein